MILLETGESLQATILKVIAGGRLYNYCEYAHILSPDEYVNKVVKGEIKDPVLSFDLKNGFGYIKILPEYIYDSRSLNYAAFIEWLNPKYRLSSTSNNMYRKKVS